ncbi:MAG: hypothetical protein N2663_07145 [Chlorobi bacterium]|nr:hypothetical protein [Chlorobiota bacterium]
MRALFIALVGACALYAQNVQTIVSAYTRAIGDAEKWKRVGTVSLVGKMTSADGSWKRSFRAWFDGKKVRTELVLQPGIVATSWTDGTAGWSIQPWTQSLVPQPLDKSSLWRLSAMAYLWRNDLLDQSQQASLEYLGSEELDGSDCYKLRARHDDGSVWMYYLDPDLGLLVKVTANIEIGGEPVQWAATLGNYQRIEGVMLPMVLETSSGTIIIEQYRLDEPLNSTLFAAPAK